MEDGVEDKMEGDRSDGGDSSSSESESEVQQRVQELQETVSFRSLPPIVWFGAVYSVVSVLPTPTI